MSSFFVKKKSENAAIVLDRKFACLDPQEFSILSRIEDSFRVIKRNLDGRPIYVWTNEHIHAHFLICFIALTIIRIWQYKVLRSEGKDTLNINGWECGITAETFINSLAEFNADRVSEEYYKVVKQDENIEKLLRIVNSNRDLRFPTEHTIRQLKSDITKYGL